MRRHQSFFIGWKSFWKHILKLFFHPIFLILTFLGNSLVLVAASFFYYFEHPVNPKVDSFLDAIWWAVATTTTVGYGEITSTLPITRILDIFVMILGTALFLSYTALFAAALFGPAMEEVEAELHQIEKDLKKLKKQS